MVTLVIAIWTLFILRLINHLLGSERAFAYFLLGGGGGIGIWTPCVTTWRLVNCMDCTSVLRPQGREVRIAVSIYYHQIIMMKSARAHINGGGNRYTFVSTNDWMGVSTI